MIPNEYILIYSVGSSLATVGIFALAVEIYLKITNRRRMTPKHKL